MIGAGLPLFQRLKLLRQKELALEMQQQLQQQQQQNNEQQSDQVIVVASTDTDPAEEAPTEEWTKQQRHISFQEQPERAFKPQLSLKSRLSLPRHPKASSACAVLEKIPSESVYPLESATSAERIETVAEVAPVTRDFGVNTKRRQSMEKKRRVERGTNTPTSAGVNSGFHPKTRQNSISAPTSNSARKAALAGFNFNSAGDRMYQRQNTVGGNSAQDGFHSVKNANSAAAYRDLESAGAQPESVKSSHRNWVAIRKPKLTMADIKMGQSMQLPYRRFQSLGDTSPNPAPQSVAPPSSGGGVKRHFKLPMKFMGARQNTIQVAHFILHLIDC